MTRRRPRHTGEEHADVHALSLMYRLAEKLGESPLQAASVKLVLRMAIRRVGEQIGAAQGRGIVRSRVIWVGYKWQADKRTQDSQRELAQEEVAGLELTAEPIETATHLRAPIRTGGAVVGMLEFLIAAADEHFLTTDCQLLSAVAFHIGAMVFLQDLTMLCDTEATGRRTLAEEAVADLRRDSMLTRLERVSAARPHSLSMFLKSSLRALRSGIPCSAALVVLENGGDDIEVVPEGANREAENDLATVVKDHWPLMADGSEVRWFDCLEWQETRERNSVCSLLVAPLRCKYQAKALIVLGRTSGEPHFTTVDAKALRLAEALLRAC